MLNELFFLGIKLLKKIAYKCEIDNLEYLGYEGLVKAISRECTKVCTDLLSGCFKVSANGEELVINCPQGKELYVKTGHNILSRIVHYEELLEIRRNMCEEIVKNLSKLLKHKLELGKNTITFTPWSTTYFQFNHVENTLTKTLAKPLGVYSTIEASTIKLSRKYANEILLKNGVEISAKKNFLEIKKHKYMVKTYLENHSETLVLTDSREKYFALKHGRNVVYGLVNDYIVFEGLSNIKLELDFSGGTLWFPAYLTVNAITLNFDENFEGKIPLWISYCSKTHGISIHTYPSAKFSIKGDTIEIREFRKAFISLHRGCWNRGGIDWFSIAHVLKPMVTISPSNITLIELQPKHVIAAGLSFKERMFEVSLYNMLDREILARIKIPWKIVNAEKRSVIKGSFLGVVDYDYNVAYVPLSPNEIANVRFEISPFAIVRSM